MIRVEYSDGIEVLPTRILDTGYDAQGSRIERRATFVQLSLSAFAAAV